jgi:hypothetical protein
MYPFHRRVGGSQRLSGPFAENNNIWSLFEVSHPRCVDLIILQGVQLKSGPYFNE